MTIDNEKRTSDTMGAVHITPAQWEQRRYDTAAKAMCALISRRDYKLESKRQLVDNAIAYADMLRRRLAEIPADAQQRSEAGMRRPRIDWAEIERISQ